jgi:predicted DsbA family dithiol-disulfide isomerase
VKGEYRNRLRIEWYSFPLEQVNSTQGPEWKLWEQSDEYKSRGLWAFRGGEAARQQGQMAFERFHISLLWARHVKNRDIADRGVLIEVARGAGLDADRFRQDLSNRNLMKRVGEDYTRGVEEHGIWGTPTLVFNGRHAAYLKLRPAPPPEESVKLFEELFDIIAGRPYVIEIKRPRLPSNFGVISSKPPGL